MHVMMLYLINELMRWMYECVTWCDK